MKCQLPDAEQKVKNLFLNWLKKKDTEDEVKIDQDLRDIVYFHGDCIFYILYNKT